MPDWEVLEQCWLSEQMSTDELLKHFNNDSAFHEWFHKRMAARHGNASSELRQNGNAAAQESIHGTG